MQKLQINLQTLLFIANNIVIGAYNEHNKILVCNTYGIMISEFTIDDMVEYIKSINKPLETKYNTDSFGINFYDHNTGGTSDFYEVEGRPI